MMRQLQTSKFVFRLCIWRTLIQLVSGCYPLPNRMKCASAPNRGYNSCDLFIFDKRMSSSSYKEGLEPKWRSFVAPKNYPK